MRRKICFVTGTRADYGLLYWLLIGVREAPNLDLSIVASCMHLSSEFGLTYREIEKDGFAIDHKIENLLSSDSAVGVGKSAGLAMMGFAEAFAAVRPDLLVLLGDRFETVSAAVAASIARIPIAHIAGGEITAGAYDDAFRHAITKMSHLHFTSTESHRQRVIQLGEDPARVFNVGAIGIENIHRLKLMDKEELEASVGFDMGERCLLTTFHPATLESASAGEQFGELLSALDARPNHRIIFTKANADNDGRIINSMIDDYVAVNANRCVAFTSMGQLRYLSAMKHCFAVVGNSSSGIVEAPSFSRPTVNIGDRQKGRTRATSVIDCKPTIDSILAALERAGSAEFAKMLSVVRNPYEKKGTSRIMLEVIRKTSLEKLLKKGFHDLNGQS